MSQAEKEKENDRDKQMTHIAGTFLIDANGSFLNGAGLGSGDYENYTIVKTFEDGRSEKGQGTYRTPFISAASWRRWLRDTLIEETGWPASLKRALDRNEKGNTGKIGTERNPVEYVEDDLFGYMYPISKKTKQIMKLKKEQLAQSQAQTQSQTQEAVIAIEETPEVEEKADTDEVEAEESATISDTTRGLFRTSPLSTSILVGLRKFGWEGKDQNYVHLVDGNAVPYKTQFMNTALQGVFCLHYSRIGVFTNIGDKLELDDDMINKYKQSEAIEEITENRPEFYGLERDEDTEAIAEAVDKDKKKKGKPKKYYQLLKKHGRVFRLKDLQQIRDERTAALLKALSHLRGGAKQAAFGTDVSPKVLIMARLTNGNPIFNTIFEDSPLHESSTRGKNVVLNIKALQEIIRDYADRIIPPVIIGIRTGYLQNESDINKLHDTVVNEVKIQVDTPIRAAEIMTDLLPSNENKLTPKQQ